MRRARAREAHALGWPAGLNGHRIGQGSNGRPLSLRRCIELA